MTAQPPLFSADYAEPLDTSSQVERWPGTADADCQADRAPDCRWPFCPCKFPDRPERKDPDA